jgi:hypothetical protein
MENVLFGGSGEEKGIKIIGISRPGTLKCLLTHFFFPPGTNPTKSASQITPECNEWTPHGGKG